jgi:hypothetical protein
MPEQPLMLVRDFHIVILRLKGIPKRLLGMILHY